MTSRPFDIVLLPEADLAAKAVRTSQELRPMGTDFILGPTACVPHVSLYMVQLKNGDLAAVGEKLAAIAAHVPRITLEAQGYSQNRGYIGLQYVRTPKIEALQQEALKAINPLRDGLRHASRDHLQHATGQTRKNLEQYGYESIGELFIPHLTFTRFSNRLPVPLEDMGAPTAFSGTFVSLALCELGPHGTCLRIVEQFPLQ